MGFTAFRGMKPFPQIMFSAFIIITSFMIFMLISMVIAIPLFGMDTILNIPGINDLNNPDKVLALKYFQIVQSIGLFIIPPFIIAWLFYGRISEYLYLNKGITSGTIIWAIMLIIFSQPFINFTGELNSNMLLPEWLSGLENWMKKTEENAALLTEVFLKVETTGGMLFNLFMIALLPALGEELLFRGVIQRIFTGWTKNHHWGIWISAILFSALHLQFYGFVPRMLLGVMFGYLLVWSGSIWLPVAAHFINNGFAVIAMFLVDKKVLDPQVENIGSTHGSYYLAALSIILVFALMWRIHKENIANAIDISSNYS